MATAMERPQEARPRSKSTFSFKSNKSHDSHGVRNETHHGHQRHSSKDEHKPHFGPTTKADPNAAMNEVQPSMFSFLPVELVNCWLCAIYITTSKSILRATAKCAFGVAIFEHVANYSKSHRRAREAYPAVPSLVPAHRCQRQPDR